MKIRIILDTNNGLEYQMLGEATDRSHAIQERNIALISAQQRSLTHLGYGLAHEAKDCPTLEVELFENSIGNIADDEHDRLPLERHIEVVRALVDCFDDGRGHLIHVGEFLRPLHACGHRGLDGAGLDGEHRDAFAVDAVP